MSAVGHLTRCLVLLAAMIGLQACSGAVQPFAKSSKLTGRAAPPIAIAQMNGLPKDKARLMTRLLRDTAAKRGVAIVAPNTPDSWILTGDFIPQSEPDGTMNVVYGWTLRDRRERVLHTISGTEPSGPASANAWAAVTPNTMRRIAGFTTENLSSRLAQLGFSTHIGGVMPPTHTFARAGPNAEKELDYETLYGPQTAATLPGGTDALAAAATEVTNDEIAAADSGADQAVEAEPVATKKPPKNPNAKSIRAVAVTSVKGAPGSGNQELTAAMRRVLKKAGWPVYKSPRPDALTISGNVDLAAATGSLQQVALAWTVQSPGGEVLGTIKQANNVKAGSLNGSWGKTADYAAQAGAEGIFNLIKKLR
ncbi:MAG: hypothetical protein ACR2OM_12185 [Aestuariivirgaceae bacterium]